MSLFPLKPTHAPVKNYYAALAQFQKHGHTTEGNTRSAFADLLKRCCPPYGWHLVEEYQFKGTAKQSLRADGALVDDLTLVHGLWEAKDSDDDIRKEIKAKVAKGYPLTNILFQSPSHAILYQDNRIAFDDSITNPEKLIEVLDCFFEHRQPHEVDWEEAVTKFAEKIPELAKGVTTILEAEDKKNPAFRENFLSFAELCRQSINPELTDDAIRKMLVQHLLTERIFRKVFNNQEFLSRNVIAAEIEKVIRSITARHFSRDEFLKPLDRFYTAIEKAAESQQGYTEKQHFLNAVYEKFFQRFDTKQADTMGIVYTPQPIVDFMVRSVDEILQQEFGKTLSDPGVHILDPFTGTGNFITRIMQQIKRSALPHKYAEELHCNEIMLLPYYIASMNIEHAYMEKVGQYLPFEGICLVDTFELAEEEQQGFSFMVEENTKRVKKQRQSPIRVVIGNPPYNANQHNENQNNKNRHYKVLSKRVADTYAKDSVAINKNTLSDPYIGALRWASDRIGDEGIVALVTNNSFVDSIAGDGVRKNLRLDFDDVFVVDLGGDVRKNPKISGTSHNVFGIQVGVSISFFVRKKKTSNLGRVFLKATDETWRRTQKLAWLAGVKSWYGVDSQEVPNNSRSTWSLRKTDDEYSTRLSLLDTPSQDGIFHTYSNGVQSNRDPWVFNFSSSQLLTNVKSFLETYNRELKHWASQKPHPPFQKVEHDETKIKWCSTLKQVFESNTAIQFDNKAAKLSLYRPFTSQWLYSDRNLLHRPGQTINFFAEPNSAIVITAHSQIPFVAQATNKITCLDAGGRPSQSFPFIVCDKDGTNRRENITDSALTEFRTHYADKKITKWDIFHAIYAVLHHPEYRTRYAANLKRELPRIPFPPDFHTFAAAGNRLMALHIDYEKQPEYKLEQIEDPKAEVTFRVERMRLNSKDKSELRYNDFLTLRGIPLAAFDYRLGNRSALEWVIDQYRVSTDARSGIVNDPNREDDPQYILRLIGQVITVSLETQQIIASLPSLQLPT